MKNEHTTERRGGFSVLFMKVWAIRLGTEQCQKYLPVLLIIVRDRSVVIRVYSFLRWPDDGKRSVKVPI